jgi:hypothetical protein
MAQPTYHAVKRESIESIPLDGAVLRLLAGRYVDENGKLHQGFVGSHSVVLLTSSVALHEPIAWGGPIVMNSAAELNQAFRDLDDGTFIREGVRTYRQPPLVPTPLLPDPPPSLSDFENRTSRQLGKRGLRLTETDKERGRVAALGALGCEGGGR